MTDFEVVNVWPMKDVQELLNRLDLDLPNDDRVNYVKRLKNLDWNKIAFNEYTGEQCHKKWDDILKQLRKFRTLSELVKDAKVLVAKPTFKQCRNSVKQHPDYPKPPLSVYFMFAKKARKKLLEQNPSMNFRDITTECAVRFRHISDSKKEKLNQRYAVAREEYEQKLKQFYEDHPKFKEKKSSTALPKTPKEVKAKKKENEGEHQQSDDSKFAVKKPFTLFHENERKLNKFESGTEQLDASRKKWKQLSDEDRLHWINLAKDQEKQTLQKHSFKHPGAISSDTIKKRNLLSKTEIELVDKMTGKPSAPPTSVYNLFVKMKMSDPELIGKVAKEKVKAISEMWKDVSTNEKKRYQNQLDEQRARYKSDFENYLDKLPEDERRQADEASTSSKKRKIDIQPNHTPKRAKSSAKTSTASVNFENAPKQPPKTAYEFFADTMLRKRDLSSDQLQKIWSKMSDLDKEQFKAKFREVRPKLNDKYLEDLKEFLFSLSPAQRKMCKLQKKQSTSTNTKENSKSKQTKNTKLKTDSSDSDSDESDANDEESDTQKNGNSDETLDEAPSDDEEASSGSDPRSDSDSDTN